MAAQLKITANAIFSIFQMYSVTDYLLTSSLHVNRKICFLSLVTLYIIPSINLIKSSICCLTLINGKLLFLFQRERERKEKEKRKEKSVTTAVFHN